MAPCRVVREKADASLRPHLHNRIQTGIWLCRALLSCFVVDRGSGGRRCVPGVRRRDVRRGGDVDVLLRGRRHLYRAAVDDDLFAFAQRVAVGIVDAGRADGEKAADDGPQRLRRVGARRKRHGALDLERRRQQEDWRVDLRGKVGAAREAGAFEVGEDDLVTPDEQRRAQVQLVGRAVERAHGGVGELDMARPGERVEGLDEPAQVVDTLRLSRSDERRRNDFDPHVQQAALELLHGALRGLLSVAGSLGASALLSNGCQRLKRRRGVPMGKSLMAGVRHRGTGCGREQLPAARGEALAPLGHRREFAAGCEPAPRLVEGGEEWSSVVSHRSSVSVRAAVRLALHRCIARTRCRRSA